MTERLRSTWVTGLRSQGTAGRDVRQDSVGVHVKRVWLVMVALSAPRFDFADSFVDGLAPIGLGDKMGFIDLKVAADLRY